MDVWLFQGGPQSLVGSPSGDSILIISHPKPESTDDA